MWVARSLNQDIKMPMVTLTLAPFSSLWTTPFYDHLLYSAGNKQQRKQFGIWCNYKWKSLLCLDYKLWRFCNVGHISRVTRVKSSHFIWKKISAVFLNLFQNFSTSKSMRWEFYLHLTSLIQHRFFNWHKKAKLLMWPCFRLEQVHTCAWWWGCQL